MAVVCYRKWFCIRLMIPWCILRFLPIPKEAVNSPNNIAPIHSMSSSSSVVSAFALYAKGPGIDSHHDCRFVPSIIYGCDVVSRSTELL